MAHESGSDWNREKLQKYLSGSILAMPRNSSGGCFILAAISPTSRAMLQNSFSTWARVFRSSTPSEKRSSASSRICSASCHDSYSDGPLSLSQMSYNSLASSCASSGSVSSSSHTGRLVVSSTSNINIEWCAVSERPLSVMILGCLRLFFSHTSTRALTESLAYSCME